VFFREQYPNFAMAHGNILNLPSIFLKKKDAKFAMKNHLQFFEKLVMSFLEN